MSCTQTSGLRTARDLRAWGGRASRAGVALLMAIAALVPMAPSTSAATSDLLFWVASKTGISDGLYGATAGTVETATNLNNQTGLGRAITTDGTFVYFSDGTHLVRTGLDGTGKTTVVAGVSAPGQIAIANGFVYYTVWGSGVFGASLASLPATANLVFTAAGASAGWSGLAISGNTIFAMNNSGSGTLGVQGLYSATLNGASAVTASRIDTDAKTVQSATLLAISGGKIYTAGKPNGFIGVRDGLGATATWSQLNVTAVTVQSIYSVAAVDSTIYFSTSNGLIGSVLTSDTSATRLTSVGQFTGAWSVTAAAQSGSDGNPATAGSSGSPPASHLQQVVMPDSGSCSDVQDADLTWGTGIRSGWGPSWAQWRPGPVCSRRISYDPSSAQWRLDP